MSVIPPRARCRQSGGGNVPAGTGQLYLGYNPGSNGSYNLSGGSLTVWNQYVGYSGSGSFTQSTGASTVSGSLVLGQNATSTGTYVLSGGSLSASSQYVGYSGTGSFTQSGGTNTAGSLVLGQNAASAGTYNLNGGVLSLAALTQGGSAAFNFNGGTFQAASSFSTSLRSFSRPVPAVLFSTRTAIP